MNLGRRILGQQVGNHGQRGQSMLELAVATPILLLLLVGAIEVGRYAYISILVANAARAGAAYGSQGLGYSKDSSGISTAAQNDFASNGQTGLNVNSNFTCGCDNGGTTTSQACNGNSAGTCSAGHWVVMVNVTASGSFNSLFTYPGVPRSISLSNTAQMRVLQQ